MVSFPFNYLQGGNFASFLSVSPLVVQERLIATVAFKKALLLRAGQFNIYQTF